MTKSCQLRDLIIYYLSENTSIYSTEQKASTGSNRHQTQLQDAFLEGFRVMSKYYNIDLGNINYQKWQHCTVKLTFSCASTLAPAGISRETILSWPSLLAVQRAVSPICMCVVSLYHYLDRYKVTQLATCTVKTQILYH